MPGTVVTATFTGAGTVIVDDSALAILIAANTTAQGALAAAFALELEKQFGATALIPGAGAGLTQIVSGQASSIAAIDKKLSDTLTKIEDLIVALGRSNKATEDQLLAMAVEHYTQLEMKTLAVMAYADQVNNNKFQQLATNAALKDAGKDPIEVKPDDFEKQIQDNVVAVGTVNAQVGATNLVQEYVVAGITKGFLISQQWIAQTGFGKWVADYYAVGKIQAQLLYADDKAARVLRDQLNIIEQRLKNPTTSATTVAGK